MHDLYKDKFLKILLRNINEVLSNWILLYWKIQCSKHLNSHKIHLKSQCNLKTQLDFIENKHRTIAMKIMRKIMRIYYTKYWNLYGYIFIGDTVLRDTCPHRSQSIHEKSGCYW